MKAGSRNPNLKEENQRRITLSPTLNFGQDRGFEIELHRRVDECFNNAGITRFATSGLHAKTLLVFTFFAISYLLLVFVAKTVWQGVLFSAMIGFSIAGIGVNLQHDGSHNAYSSRGSINRMMAMTADFIGASSFFWRWKHNRIHHTYTNIAPYDTDINLGILARIAPSSKRLWFHQWQHLYLWMFYGLLVIKWQLFDDFYNLIRGRLGNHIIPRPNGFELFVFIIGKIVFLSWAFAIPLLFHPLGYVLVLYGLAMAIAGMTLSLIFILPHGVGEAAFPLPDRNTGLVVDPRAVHQVRVTVDFMRHNQLVTWLVGGLNLHREHHLFPSISHVHYPRIVPIVDDVCEKFGIAHYEHRSYFAGLASHYRWLKCMGRQSAEDQK